MNQRHPSMKLIASAVVFTFTLTSLGITPETFAATGVSALAGEVSPLTAGTLAIPAELGQVTETVTGDPKAPAFIHIQSAHGNYQAEKNIEKLLSYIEKNSSVKTMLLEGAAGKLNPELFRIFPGNPDFNRKITDKLMQEGYLTGPENFLINQDIGWRKENGEKAGSAPSAIHHPSSDSMQAFGMEDLDAYKKDREAFINVVRKEKTAENYLMKLRASIDKRFASKLNKDLLNLVRQEEALGSGTVSFASWIKTLGEGSKKHLKTDLSDAFYQDQYPSLIRYFRLQAIGSKIDRDKASVEEASFLKELEKRHISKEIINLFQDGGGRRAEGAKTGTPSTIHHSISAAGGYSTLRRAFDHAFDKLPKDFSMKAWPNWTLYAQFTILMQEMESKGLHEETVRLKEKIQTALAKTPEEKEYLSQARQLYLLKRLFSLELTREEYEELLQRRAVSGERRENPKASLNAPRSTLYALEEKAMEFYSTAIVREQHMFSNALQQMSFQKQQRAVIVTGGFHADGLKKLAASKHCSYLQITPRIQEVSKRDHEVYLRSMLGNRELETSQIAALLGLTGQAQRVAVTGMAATKGWVGDIRRIISDMINSESNNSRLKSAFSKSVFGIPTSNFVSAVGRSEVREKQTADRRLQTPAKASSLQSEKSPATDTSAGKRSEMRKVIHEQKGVPTEDILDVEAQKKKITAAIDQKTDEIMLHVNDEGWHPSDVRDHANAYEHASVRNLRTFDEYELVAGMLDALASWGSNVYTGYDTDVNHGDTWNERTVVEYDYRRLHSFLGSSRFSGLHDLAARRSALLTLAKSLEKRPDDREGDAYKRFVQEVESVSNSLSAEPRPEAGVSKKSRSEVRETEDPDAEIERILTGIKTDRSLANEANLIFAVRNLATDHWSEGRDLGGYDHNLQSYYGVARTVSKNPKAFELMTEIGRLNPAAFSQKVWNILNLSKEIARVTSSLDDTTSYLRHDVSEATSSEDELTRIRLEAEAIFLKVNTGIVTNPRPEAGASEKSRSEVREGDKARKTSNAWASQIAVVARTFRLFMRYPEVDIQAAAVLTRTLFETEKTPAEIIEVYQDVLAEIKGELHKNDYARDAFQAALLTEAHFLSGISAGIIASAYGQYYFTGFLSALRVFGNFASIVHAFLTRATARVAVSGGYNLAEFRASGEAERIVRGAYEGIYKEIEKLVAGRESLFDHPLILAEVQAVLTDTHFKTGMPLERITASFYQLGSSWANEAFNDWRSAVAAQAILKTGQSIQVFMSVRSRLGVVTKNDWLAASILAETVLTPRKAPIKYRPDLGISKGARFKVRTLMENREKLEALKEQLLGIKEQIRIVNISIDTLDRILQKRADPDWDYYDSSSWEEGLSDDETPEADLEREQKKKKGLLVQKRQLEQEIRALQEKIKAATKKSRSEVRGTETSRSEARLTPAQEEALKQVEAKYKDAPYIPKYARMAMLYMGRSPDLHFKEIQSAYVAAKHDGEGFSQTEFSTIQGNPDLIKLAKTMVVQVLSLDGGLGEKLQRALWKAWLLAKSFLSPDEVVLDENGNPKLGAKGTDMGYFVKMSGKTRYVSVSESKLINLYRQGKQARFKGLRFRPIVNAASRPSYEALFEKTNLLGITAKGASKPMTYRELLKSVDVTVDDYLFQDKVPGLRVVTDATEKAVFLPATSASGYYQEGGHGQIGVFTVIHPEDYKAQSGGPDFVAFTNGDGQVSSDINPEIIGDMLKHNRAIGNLVTSATRVDRKGGKYIVKLLEYNGVEKWVPGQRELAAAQELGKKSETEFYKAGQPDGKAIFGPDSVGKQPFNTNTFYINQARLMPFLADLKRAMGEDAYLAEVIAPNFMKKATKPGKDGFEYYPLDSAIGNVYHNINEFVLRMSMVEEAKKKGTVKLSVEQEKILEAIKKHKMMEVIHYYNVPRSMFTPQKNPLDALLQMLGKYYRYNTKSGNLAETEEGLVPPEVTIVDAEGNAQDSGKGYYSEFMNMLRTFVSTGSIAKIMRSPFDVRKLDKLVIAGNISIPDVVFQGQVKITNQFVFDLRKAILSDPGLREQVGFKKGEPLTLKDLEITIRPDGRVKIVKTLPVEVAKAAETLVDHLAASSQDIPKDPVVVVLGNPIKGYPAYVAKVLKELNASKVLVVGNGVQSDDRAKVAPEWKRIREALIEIDPSLKDKILVDPNDDSMNHGQNVEFVISILNREKLSPEGVVLIQAPQGLRVAQRIFEKQWTEKEKKAAAVPKFYTYALPEYVTQVNEFLRTGNVSLEAGILTFQKDAARPSQGLLKDLVGQMGRLRNWNGTHLYAKTEVDLPAVAVGAEATVNQYFQTEEMSAAKSRSEARNAGVKMVPEDGLWTLEYLDPDETWSVDGPVATAWSPDGKALWIGQPLSGNHQRPLHVFEFSSGHRKERRFAMPDVQEGYEALAVSPDSRYLAAVTDTMFFWISEITEHGPGLPVAEGSLDVGAASIVFSPDGQYLAVGGALNNDVAIFKLQRSPSGAVRGLSPVKTFPLPNSGLHITLAFTRDGGHLFASDLGGRFHVYDFQTLLTQEPEEASVYEGRVTSGVHSLAISPNGRLLTFAGEQAQGGGAILSFELILDKKGRLKDINPKPVQVVDLRSVFSKSIASIAYLPNNRGLIIGGHQGGMAYYELNARSEVRAKGVLPRVDPSKLKEWGYLKGAARLKPINLAEEDRNDHYRRENLSVDLGDFYFDATKNHISQGFLGLLIGLAEKTGLRKSIDLMFAGAPINETEKRAVFHMALRNIKKDEATGAWISAGPMLVDGKDVMPEVLQVLRQMADFVRSVHNGTRLGYTNKPFKNVVVEGIGGSYLGPEMAVLALEMFKVTGMNFYFVANVDGADVASKVTGQMAGVPRGLDPEETLVVVLSKTYTTQETIMNASTTKEWLLKHYQGDEKAVASHFVAVSTATKEVDAFGITPDQDHMFPFWDWVGGRYSMWSAIGLPIMLAVGPENFYQMLAGAHEMDEHFRTAPFAKNIPVLKALIDIWNRIFRGMTVFIVSPYAQLLSRLGAYLQQLFMESNGKSVDRNGDRVTYNTSSSVFGEPMSNGQHAYKQQGHQGDQPIPEDFIGFINPSHTVPEHHGVLLANLLGQKEAQAVGKTTEVALAELKADQQKKPEKYRGWTEEDFLWMAKHKTFEGNKPSNLILIDDLTPRTFGKLIAMYEHQVAAEGFILNIFSFDQWGVELGKVLAKTIHPLLKGTEDVEKAGLTSSTAFAIRRIIERTRPQPEAPSAEAKIEMPKDMSRSEVRVDAAVLESPIQALSGLPVRSNELAEATEGSSALSKLASVKVPFAALLKTAQEVTGGIFERAVTVAKASWHKIISALFPEHLEAAPVLPETFASIAPIFRQIVARSQADSAGRMVIDQRQGIPDAASVLPLVTFARYNPKASVVLALIADASEVAMFEKELAALNPKGTLPRNMKVRAFANENAFVGAFAGFYNNAAPAGQSVALITDRENSVVTRKIGSRRHLLSVVGAKDPLKQTASTLLAADKLLNESIWSLGYHFVSVEKLGGLEALMAELTTYVAAQAKVLASA